jgi:hypothetical protein
MEPIILDINEISCPICNAKMAWADGNRFFCGGGEEHSSLFIVIEFEDDIEG